MAKEDLRSRTPAFGVQSSSIGHVRPETKPIVNPEVAGRISPKQVQVIPTPSGPVNSNSAPAGPQA